MKYSVWNSGSYSVYESPFPASKRMNSQTSLGAIPNQIIGILPSGSRYLGESDKAVGQIVVKTIGFREFLIFTAAAVVAKLIYDILK